MKSHSGHLRDESGNKRRHPYLAGKRERKRI